jgi:RNA polymerase sigma factor (sigma-70 family)
VDRQEPIDLLAMNGQRASWAAAVAGNRGGWDAIVARYARLVWAVARSFRLSAADAADVSQVTWLRLVENLDRIRDPDALGSWLATTARREAITLLRHRRDAPLPEYDRAELADEREPPPWQGLLVDERNQELWQAYRRLPERCQTLLRLLVLEGEGSYAAAAAALDVPVGSLGPTRARCLATLRGYLETRSGQGGEQG